MQEHQRTENTFLSKLGFWLGSVISTVLLIVCLWGIFTVRQYIPFVGMVIIVSIPLLIVGAVAFLIAKGLSHLLEYKATEIGPSGHVFSRWGKLTMVHPLGVKEFKAKDIEAAKQAEKIEVPSILSLLKEGLIGGADLLMGFHLDGTPRYGLWDDLRTFIVAGKSRSGKTVTMVFFILQALMSGANVYICDPHARKKDGLLKVLDSLVPWLYCARNAEEIVALAKQFTGEMQARESGTSEDKTPCLFVVDEWTKLLRDLAPYEVEIMVDVFLNCAEAWAAFGGYALIAGHEWTARESGGKRGAALRKNTHAAFVHRLDSDYAKFLLQGGKGKKAANNAPNLPRGHAHLQDSEGELDYLIIPYYGAKFEAVIEVSQMLLSYSSDPGLPSGEKDKLTGPDYQMLPPGHTVNDYGNGRQAEETPVNTVIEPLHSKEVQVYQGPNSLQAQYGTEDPVNTEGVNERLTDKQIKALIARMHKRNIKLRDISYTVSLYGRNYDQFKAYCLELGIAVTETV
jgi:hypothetical protein